MPRRLHWWLLICLALCRAHLYLTGSEWKKSCRCCDADGCDIVEKNAPRPMPFSLTWFRERSAIEEAKDDRPEISYDDAE